MKFLNLSLFSAPFLALALAVVALFPPIASANSDTDTQCVTFRWKAEPVGDVKESISGILSLGFYHEKYYKHHAIFENDCGERVTVYYRTILHYSAHVPKSEKGCSTREELEISDGRTGKVSFAKARERPSIDYCVDLSGPGSRSSDDPGCVRRGQPKCPPS